LEFLSAGNPALLYLAGDGCLSLLSCEAPPPAEGCAELPQPGATYTPVTWDAASFFAVTQTGTTIAKTSPFPPTLVPNYQCFAATEDVITANGEGFQFFVPVPTTPGSISIGLGEVPAEPPTDCGNGSVIIGNACRWLDHFPFFLFRFGLGGSGLLANVQTDSTPPTSNFLITPGSVYNIIRCGDTYCFYADNVLRKQSAGPIFASARLIVWIDFSEEQEPSVDDLITDVTFMTDLACGS
jgi:hypothetical protein